MTEDEIEKEVLTLAGKVRARMAETGTNLIILLYQESILASLAVLVCSLVARTIVMHSNDVRPDKDKAASSLDNLAELSSFEVAWLSVSGANPQDLHRRMPTCRPPLVKPAVLISFGNKLFWKGARFLLSATEAEVFARALSYELPGMRPIVCDLGESSLFDKVTSERAGEILEGYGISFDPKLERPWTMGNLPRL